MATLFEQSSDIYVKDRPVGLSERDPDIFRDYAISRDTAISIMPSMEELIADPTFRRSVKEILGRLTLVDIKVRGEDGAVLVKDPHAPDSHYEEVDFRARAAVREVSNRTQAAYRRLMGSPSSSCETSPRRVSSPVYDHTAPTARPYRAHSYHHIPSPTARSEFYESRIHELESENRELRGRVENLELQHQLERSEQLRKDAMEQLGGAREEISQLGETITALRAELERTQQTLQRTNESLAASVLVNLLLATALQGMGGRNAELQSQLEQLQEQHRALGIHSKAHDLILQRAQELTEATSPADLISKIEGLQEALASEKQRSSDLERRLQAADQELSKLRPANQELRRDLQQARQELAEIADAVKDGRRSGETLPQLARRYHQTIGRLEHQLQTTLQANRGLQQTIDGVRSELPEVPEHDSDLPGAVRALRVAKEEAEHARQSLHEELEALKPQHSDKVAILDRIGVVLDKKREPHENIPDLVRALGSENRQLKEKIAQHVAAQSRLGEILVRVAELTGEQVETMEDLPSAVERALGRVEKRAETANRRADSLQERVSALTEELRKKQSTHQEEIASKQEVIRKLEVRASHAEAELEGQDEHVLDLQSQAQELRQECGRLAKALRETNRQHAEEVSGLKRELQSAQHDLAQERETTAALRKEVRALKQAARETEQRHQEALRKQEAAHLREITPLRERLQEVTHLNGEQAKRIAALEEDLEAAREATRVSDQRRQRELHEQEETHQGIVKPLREEVAALTESVQSLQQQLQDRAALSQQELEALQEETERLRGLLGEIDSIAQKVPIDREPRSLADELAGIGIGTDFQELEEATLTPQYTQLPGEVQETINALLKQIQALKRNNRTVEELEAEISDLKLQLADQKQRATSTQEALQSRIDDLEAQKAEVLEDAKRQLAEKDALINRLRSTISRERSEKTEALQEKDERIEELETKLRESEDRQKRLLFEFNKQKEELVAERQLTEELDRDVDRLSGDKRRLEQTLAGMRKTIQELEEERDSWQEEAEFYSAKHSELLRRNEALQRQCSRLQDETSQLRGILGTTLSVPATADLDEFHSAQTDLQGRMEDMTSQIDVLSRQAASVEEARARLQERHEEVSQERDEALERNRFLEDYSTQHKQAYQQLEEELQRIVTETSREWQRVRQEWSEKEQELTSRITAHEDHVQELLLQNMNLEDQLEALREEQRVSNNVIIEQEGQIDQGRETIENLEAQLEENRLALEKAELRADTEAFRGVTLSAENRRLERELGTAKEQAESRREQLEKATKALAVAERRIEELTEDYQSAQERAKDLQRDLREHEALFPLFGDIEGITSPQSTSEAADRLRQIKEERDSIKRSQQLAQENAAELGEALGLAQADLKRQAERIKHLEKSLEHELETTIPLQLERDKAVQQQEQLSRELSETRAAASLAKAQGEELLATQKDLQRQLQESREQAELLRQEKRELVDQSSEQVAELERMRAELEKNRKLADEMKQLEGSLQAMKKSLNLRGNTESGFKIFDYFRREYLSLKEQLKSLQDQLVILRRKNLMQEDQISELTTSMGTRGSELAQANRELSTQVSHLKEQISELEREKTKQLAALRVENTQLRETLDAHRHSSAEQEEILQRAIAEKAEELQRLQEIEEARRLHELDEQQRQELRAADAGEIMGEIARGMEGSGLNFEDVTGSKMPPWIKEYLQSMKAGSLPRRHAQTAASEISQLNEKPYPLADLKLFTGFFQVTDHVSGLRGSKAFLQLKANNAILAQLNPETQQEAIKRIKGQNTAIIRGLLNGFFAKVNEVAGESSGLSRFGNIRMQLWIWNTIFHGLSTEFYDESGGEKSFKKTRVKTINLTNAEKMRTTVHDLHSRFQEMMRPFVTV